MKNTMWGMVHKFLFSFFEHVSMDLVQNGFKTPFCTPKSIKIAIVQIYLFTSFLSLLLSLFLFNWFKIHIHTVEKLWPMGAIGALVGPSCRLHCAQETKTNVR